MAKRPIGEIVYDAFKDEGKEMSAKDKAAATREHAQLGGVADMIMTGDLEASAVPEKDRPGVEEVINERLMDMRDGYDEKVAELKRKLDEEVAELTRVMHEKRKPLLEAREQLEIGKTRKGIEDAENQDRRAAA